MLTDKQSNVLNAVKKYISETNESPSLGDLQQILGISSKRGVVQFLESLEKKGYIQRVGARGIVVKGVTSNNRFISLPVLGYANCGKPIARADDEKIGEIQVESKLLSLKNDLFVIIAKGDSMDKKIVNGKNINDKDYVVIAKNQPIFNGDAVVAIIDDSATIKCFKKIEDQIILYPDSNNPMHQPIFLSDDDENFIIGKVITVLHNPN